MTATSLETSRSSATVGSVRRNLYLRLWRGVPQELAFLLLTLPVASVGFGISVAFLSAGLGTLVTFFIGVFVLAGLFYIARGFGALELIRLAWAGRAPVARPEWPRYSGFWGWLRSLFGNGHYWLYVLHTAIINYAVSLVTWIITVVWVSVGLGGISQWFWDWFIPREELSGDHYYGYLSQWLTGVFGGEVAADQVGGVGFRELDHILFAVLGLVLLSTLPFVTRGLVMVHYGVARLMLSAFPSDGLKRELREANVSRGAAISAEGHSLRRLERDIHDGPQQRLVRLQMDLAAAERQLDSNPDAARALIEQSKTLAHDALEELRALSRGFAPPILMDRGLVAALESLASRSVQSVTVDNALDDGVELPVETERNAYFFASELVSNAAKHSGATAVTISVALRGVPEKHDQWLDVRVTDDGRGGANSNEGHGLSGLEERLRGLGGALELDSPNGGPTTVIGRFPVAR